MSLLPASSWQKTVKAKPSLARCGLCGLAKRCFTPKMPVTGCGERKVLFIGEAPGEQEDRQGIQLVGEAGAFLKDILNDMGYDLEDCWKTNAVRCHSPENKIEPKHVQACRPSVIKSIQKLRPKVIILLGRSAVDSVLSPLWQKDLGKIDRWCGWSIPVGEYGAWVCPTYHPSYLLRSDSSGNGLLEIIFRKHLKQAFNKLTTPIKAPSLSDLQQEVEIITQERSAKRRLRDLLRQKGLVAWDYETTGLKPERADQRIVSVSFCFNGEDSFAFPFTDGTKRLVSKILRNPKLLKIASNMKFEERWTRAKLGHGVAGWYWDTMLAAHCLDNRSYVTSIKFQAFVHLGIADYSSHMSNYFRSAGPNELNKIDDINQRDLLLYNGMDSLLEYLVARKQMEIMGDCNDSL